MIGEVVGFSYHLSFFKLAAMTAEPNSDVQKIIVPVRPHVTDDVNGYLVLAWNALDRMYFVWVENFVYGENAILAGEITFKDMGRATNGSKQNLQIYPTNERDSCEAQIVQAVQNNGSEFFKQKDAMALLTQMIGVDTLGEEIRKEIVFINEAKTQPFNITD